MIALSSDYFGFCQEITIRADYHKDEIVSKKIIPPSEINAYADLIGRRKVEMVGAKTTDTAFYDKVKFQVNPNEKEMDIRCERVVLGGGQSKTLLYALRGGKLYRPIHGEWHIVEWIISIGLAIKMPIGSIVVKIIAPIIYAALQTIGAIASLLCDTKGLYEKIRALDEECHCQRAWENLTPFKAVLGLIIHPALAIISLMPGTSPYFHKWIGDLERWENGHTYQDVQEKSLGARQREAVYLAPCQQPVGALSTGYRQALSKNLNVSLEKGPVGHLMQRILLRQIFKEDYLATHHPIVEKEGGK